MNSMTEALNYVKNKKFLDALGIPDADSLIIEPLAQGEYHKNYVFTHPVSGQKLVLRINHGSQMHLQNQIKYEYDTLHLLQESGRTPIPVYLDDSLNVIPQGILVMNYIEGEPLNYRTDLLAGAQCLADVHSVPVPAKSHLLSPEQPLYAILEECTEMFSVYQNSKYARKETYSWISQLMNMACEKAKGAASDQYQACCINTELNNCNFLVDKDTHFVSLIDWEKPLFGDPAQDLGHMLAPTTTFWKTDTILSDDEIEQFIDYYIDAIDNRIDLGELRVRTHLFLPITCLRGITWCAMAWDEYNRPERTLKNQDTYNKLSAYLSDEYLSRIESFLIHH